MEIRLTKLTDDRHRLQVRRDDDSVDTVELETRSLLLHDLVHLAVETEAGLTRGFWGLVAAGHRLDALRLDPTGETFAELAIAETLVGPMQAVWSGQLDPARYTALASGRTARVDATFVQRVQARLRALTGHWRATPFHDPMVVHWPLT